MQTSRNPWFALSPRFLFLVRLVAIVSLSALTAGTPAAGQSSSKLRRKTPQTPTQATVPKTAGQMPAGSTSVSIPTINQIADGRAISSGGAPPEYTFKSLWKKALAAAQKWHGDAYLVRALGRYINNDGVPSYWSLTFLSPSDQLYRLDMEIDPWGNVSKENVWKGGTQPELRRHRGVYGVAPIPAHVVDSDLMMNKAFPAASAKFPMGKTTDPAAELKWDEETKKLVWSYIFFYRSTAEYCGVNLDAMSGQVLNVWRGSSKLP